MSKINKSDMMEHILRAYKDFGAARLLSIDDLGDAPERKVCDILDEIWDIHFGIDDDYRDKTADAYRMGATRARQAIFSMDEELARLVSEVQERSLQEIADARNITHGEAKNMLDKVIATLAKFGVNYKMVVRILRKEVI